MAGEVGFVFFTSSIVLLMSRVSIARIDVIVSRITVSVELQDPN